jgi:hypothetical protein
MCVAVGNGCLGKQLLLCLSRCVDNSLERNPEKQYCNAVQALAACCFVRSLKQVPETGTFSATQSHPMTVKHFHRTLHEPDDRIIRS